MTLLQFIKSKLNEESPAGDIARDSKRDEEFKLFKTDATRMKYLEGITYQNSDEFEEFKNEFKSINKK